MPSPIFLSRCLKVNTGWIMYDKLESKQKNHLTITRGGFFDDSY
ncbi:hypothetical protein FB479_103770 [Brevibacillus sp. AG162]|nr:hypothetical protein FB479_103770 [Brevibacillus sp. AG162]